MTLAEARALCPGLLCLEHQPAPDARALDALGRWMTRFTPDVATGWPDLTPEPRSSKSKSPPPSPPALLLLNLTGCERLFGGIAPLARRIAAALDHFDLRASIAIAPTPGAAWALASCLGTGSGNKAIIGKWEPASRKAPQTSSSSLATSSPPIVEAHDLLAALADLPIAALRLDAQIVHDLHHLGLHAIGQVLALPREALPARFGPTLSLRLDQLIGQRPEPLISLAYDPPIQAAMRFDGPVESLETLWEVLRELLNCILLDLQRRGRGARRLELLCTPDRLSHQNPVSRVIHLSRPTRDVASIFNLLRCATENLDCGEGFVRIQLKAPEHERITDEQIDLLSGKRHAGALEFDRLLDRLGVRLGQQAVVTPVLTESRLPERAWRALLPHETSPPGFIPATEDRPLHLFPRPLELKVIAEPCEHWEARPTQFAHGGSVHRLVHVLGPERIAGEWWRGHYKTRDYYDVDDDAGRRFWIFRVVSTLAEKTTTRWFLHGLFQ